MIRYYRESNKTIVAMFKETEKIHGYYGNTYKTIITMETDVEQWLLWRFKQNNGYHGYAKTNSDYED